MTKPQRQQPTEATHALFMHDTEPQGAAVAQVAVAHWFGWNIAMGTEELLTQTKQIFEQLDIQAIGGTGGFLTGVGVKRQAVTLFTAVTDDFPRSFCSLTVSDPSRSQSEELCSQIRDALRSRLGVS